MEDSATPTRAHGPHPMTRRNHLTRLTLWHPPARARRIPPGRLLSRHAPAALALTAALLASTAPAHAADRLARVVVVERAPASPAAERVVRRHGGAVGRRLSLAGGFAARVPVRALPALRRSRAVAGVWSDARVTTRSGPDCLPGDSLCFDALPPEAAWRQAIGLDRVPNKYQGDGLTVASIDTGVAPNADLGGRLLARVDLTGERDGIDRFGHGTHMAGIIAGDGTTSDGAFEGAAPETNLVSVKVAGWDGATDVSTVIAALQWVVSNRARFGIRVVNLSWGTDSTAGYGVDPLDRAVERAWQAGLVVVVSAGNQGPAAGTISKPGDDPFVITVGAADTNGTATSRDDVLAPFSSRGPTPDGVGKPDLLAPGVSIVSDRAPGSTVDTFRPLARLGTSLFKGSGTSQAAAVVSGVAARMLEADPTLTNDDVKGVLTATADPRLAGPGAGAGLVDAADAVAAVTPPKKGPPPVLPVANAGLRASTGSGSLAASRGTLRTYTDLDGDGVPDPVSGEVDALGRAWDPAAYTAEDWTAATWEGSPWAPLTSETAGASGSASAGPAAPTLAWDPAYWGAPSAIAAGWDAKFWGAKFWGAKFWGASAWR
jgi:serine protease AprX